VVLHSGPEGGVVGLLSEFLSRGNVTLAVLAPLLVVGGRNHNNPITSDQPKPMPGTHGAPALGTSLETHQKPQPGNWDGSLALNATLAIKKICRSVSSAAAMGAPHGQNGKFNPL
jgi:hypothetical protein